MTIYRGFYRDFIRETSGKWRRREGREKTEVPKTTKRMLIVIKFSMMREGQEEEDQFHPAIISGNIRSTRNPNKTNFISYMPRKHVTWLHVRTRLSAEKSFAAFPAVLFPRLWFTINFITLSRSAAAA